MHAFNTRFLMSAIAIAAACAAILGDAGAAPN